MSAPTETFFSGHYLDLPAGPLLDKARLVARAAQEQEGRALLVGGWVRDALMGQSPKDADIEVFGIQPDDLRKLLRRFGRVGCVGESFRVYKLSWHDQDADKERHELDVSIPRRDRKVGEGHKGFEIEGDPFASFEDAARRRDFTINAIGCDPLTGELLDPYGGCADLAARRLRMVDAAHFGEDSLRVLRAMQFAARLELSLDADLVALCQATELSDLPRERIWTEWEKLLLKAQRPSLGLRAAQELGILSKLFPLLHAEMRLRGEAVCERVDRAAVERAALPVEQQVTLLLVAICLSLQKSALLEWLEALGLFTLNRYDVRENALRLHENSAQVRELWETREQADTDARLRRLSVRCTPRLLYHLARAQSENEAAEWFLTKVQELDVLDGPPEPFLKGRHLIEMGVKPGPQMGELTRAVYEKQLDGDIAQLDEALEYTRALL
jgi:tRNA nucleotidyltransferase (CCA-adding enzyme)